MSDSTLFGGPFAVFGPSGQMLGNLTSIQGQPPALGSNSSAIGYLNNTGTAINGSSIGVGGPASSPGASGSSGFTNIGGASITTPGGAASSTPTANPVANANPTAGNGPVAGSLADYFARAIIVIVGFIFIAIGLNMLRGQPALQVPFAHK